jgi:hypothetical protein
MLFERKKSRSWINTPELIFENLTTVFWVKKTSGTLSTLDPVSGMGKIGSGIRSTPGNLRDFRVNNVIHRHV